MKEVPPRLSYVEPFLSEGRYPTKLGIAWPSKRFWIDEYARVAFGIAKALLAGMKYVRSGVLSKVSVRP